MNELHLVKLLGQVISQILERHEKKSEGTEVAEEIAEVCWDGLILLLRESLLQSGDISLEGLGHFKREGEDWTFLPAVAIAEIEALRLNPEEGNRLLARRAVSLLRYGLSILEAIPADVAYLEVEAEIILTPEEKLLKAIFGDEAVPSSQRLSDRVASLAAAIQESGKRLTFDQASYGTGAIATARFIGLDNSDEEKDEQLKIEAEP